MQKKFQLKGTTIQVQDQHISLKQMFMGEDFQKKDIMDLQLLDKQLIIKTRRNQFKCKYTEKQAKDAQELFSYLSDNQNQSNDKSLAMIRVNYFGGHPNMSEEGWADMDIRSNRLLVSTFQKTGQIEFKSIVKVHYENEQQIVRRLPKERLALLNTLSVHLRSHPKSSKYYFTIDFLNSLGDKFCAVYGGKDAEKAYETVKNLINKDSADKKVESKKELKSMNNFTYHVPTNIHFGQGAIKYLSEMKESGNRVLFVYGGGSIKRNGIYDDVLKICEESKISIFELSGVEPNPRIDTVRKGVEICKRESIDMVCAVGGGSTIDCAKVVAAGALYDGDAWDLVMDSRKIEKALPIYTVLTMAATGSEMDGIAVISNPEIPYKKGTRAQCLKPKMSILDPTYTYTVSKRQSSAGVIDMMSHVLENYFTNVDGAFLQARYCEGLLQTIIQYGPVVLENPTDYNARANLMWTASQAINGILSSGAEVAWSTHPTEHELSAYYDITHGEGLGILTPVWMEYVLSEATVSKFYEYGVNVWHLNPKDKPMKVAQEAIQCTKHFIFDVMGCPKTLRDVGIIDDHAFEKMAESAAKGCKHSYVPLTKEDIINIYKKAL